MEKNEQKFGFYTAAWCVADNWNNTRDGNKTASELSMRKSVPFEFLGESALKYGSKSPITIVMLEGYQYLSAGYIKELENLNFRVINYEEKFKKIVALFPNINKKYNIFERNCFLRWLVFKDLAEEDGISHFLHIDSDLVLYTPLEEIAEDTKNKTFMLQGCPAFLSVSERGWFDIYESELKKFEKNISEYSKTAASEKEATKEKSDEICNVSSWRNPIGSDQDLLEYLIASRKIPQNTSEEIFNSNLFLIQNPLLIQYWAEKQGINREQKIIEKDGNIYYGSKKIAFTHYQGTFCFYANIFSIAHYFFPWNMLGLENFLYYKIEVSKFRIPKIAKYIWKVAKIFGWRMERKDFMKYMESPDKNGQKRLVDVLNFLKSSKKNIFRLE
jgi:hypothetical protein